MVVSRIARIHQVRTHGNRRNIRRRRCRLGRLREVNLAVPVDPNQQIRPAVAVQVSDSGRKLIAETAAEELPASVLVPAKTAL